MVPRGISKESVAQTCCLRLPGGGLEPAFRSRHFHEDAAWDSFSSTGFFLATFFLPLLFPFDLEKYLKFHYLKTRDQTLTLLDVFARDGKRRGLPVENIRILLQGLLDSA